MVSFKNLKKLCDEIYQKSNSENCHQTEWNIQLTDLNVDLNSKKLSYK